MEDLIIECPECHANFYNINDSVLQKCPVCKKIFNIEQLEESESPCEAEHTEEESESSYESDETNNELLESPYESEDTREEESESPYESEDIREEESENAYILDDTSNEVLKDTTEANTVSNKQTESSKNTRGIIRNILYFILFFVAIWEEGEITDPAKGDKNISPMVAFLILLPFILIIIWLIVLRIQGNF